MEEPKGYRALFFGGPDANKGYIPKGNENYVKGFSHISIKLIKENIPKTKFLLSTFIYED